MKKLITYLVVSVWSGATFADTSDPTELIAGVSELTVGGWPGPVYPENDAWLPIVGGDQDTSYPSLIVMARDFGKGRVIADSQLIGHDPDILDNRVFQENVLLWLVGEPDGSVGYTIGHDEYNFPQIQNLEKVAKSIGISVDSIPAPITAKSLKGYSALVICIASAPFTTDEIDVIEEWVYDGGALLLKGLGWAWLSYHPDQTMEDYPMMHLGSRFGARWLDGTVEDPTNQHDGLPVFHTFYPDIDGIRPQQCFARIVKLHKSHGSDLPAFIEQNDMEKHRFMQAHAGLAVPSQEFPEDHSDQQLVYDASVSLFEQWPDFYARGFSFDEQSVPASVWTRERAWLTWCDSMELTEPRREQIAKIGQLEDMRRSLFMQYSTILLDNDRIDIPEIQLVCDLIDLTPSNMLTLGSISVVDYLSSPKDRPTIFNLSSNRHGVNVTAGEVGQTIENPFPPDIDQYDGDAYIATVSHEFNHVVDAIAAQNLQWTQRKMQLIEDAGEEAINYLRSMGFKDGFFVENPQEFFAAIANQWFAKSELTLELGLVRFNDARPDPINQALFFADTYSQGSHITWFYTSDGTGLVTRDPALLIRDGKNRIIGLDYAGVRYDFSLDSDGRVIEYNTFDGVTGACCIENICIQVNQDSCLLVSGHYLGHKVQCAREECLPPCEGDVTQDELVNVLDLLTVIDQWGLTNSPADVNADGIVNVSDLLIVVGNWGPCE